MLTHNAFPVVIGLAWLFGEGIKFAGLTIGAALLGSFVGVELFNRQKQKEQNYKISFHIGSCGSPCPDPDDDENNKRKFNTVTKTEFFKKIEEHYEYYKDNVYKRKKNADGIEKAEYLKWDSLHNDVEAYAKNKWHMGSIDPKSLKMYKGPKHAKLRI